jgi:hypothetical protein
MAQKHKSKYKTPKDFEKSQKPKPRKDLKDYTEDDKKGGLNPKSTGDKQLNVLRKTDKAVQDDGKMFPKYNDDDRLYKDLEDGEYDPKTAAKRLKKRQDTEEKETTDVLKDKIENLTREQKERLVREYVRRKIAKVLFEQEEPTPPAEEEPAAPEALAPEAPAPDAAAPATPPTDVPPTPDAAAAPETPPMDAGAMPTGGGALAPSTPSPTPDAGAPAPDATAAPTTPPAEGEPTAATDAAAPAPSPEEETDKVINTVATRLSKEGAIGKVKLLNKILKTSMNEVDVEDQANFYKLLRSYAVKKLSTMSIAGSSAESETSKS